MTYLNFLILFVILPAIMLVILFRHHLTKRWWGSIGLLAVIAVIWTTPWDNFIVAYGVWWYDPKLVLGVIIGYVPLEEYSFFVLQTAMTGILLAGLAGAGNFGTAPLRRLKIGYRILPGLLLLVLTLIMVISGQRGFDYLILLLGWLSFIPLSLQWAFGLDILLQRWQIWLVGVAVPTVWLTAMDSIAIHSGTWTINPAQTTGIMLPGGVPIEEGIFFLLTNMLIVQGVLLATAPESWNRLTGIRLWLFSSRFSQFSQE